MNCTEVRVRLPLYLYHDLKPDEGAAVERHLTTCAACRRERADLERVRRALAAVPAPAVQVDLTRLFEQTANWQAGRARRWRRAAFALCSLAAALLVAVAVRLEVRVGAGQLVLRSGWWGNSSAGPARPAALPRLEPAPGSDVAERVQLLSEMVHALAADVEARDARGQENLARLRQRLELLGRVVSFRLNDSERRAALWRAAFVLPPTKGDENP
jgi:predicted anti-sigma-YlaC factor YlaD